MARMIGYFANQADRIRCALVLEGSALTLDPTEQVDGWGVGSYQGTEVLLRRRPTEQREAVDYRDLVQNLRTDCALIHVRRATGGNRSLENTHPFRFRQWLFAHTGSVPGFSVLRPRMIDLLPDFLARNVRGETDSELVFALFLSFVYETGRLDDPELDRRAIADALRKTVAALDGLSDAAGQARATVNAVATNHHAMVAVRRGLPMSWVRRHGIRDCAACRRPPEISGREPKRIDHEAFKYVIVASDLGEVPAGWFAVPEVPSGALVAIDRALDVQVIQT